jgi:hypothetical protein
MHAKTLLAPLALSRLGVAFLLGTPSEALGAEGSSGLIETGDLVYKLAFRLPDVAGGCDWTDGGHGMTYDPSGDPDGHDDGYPGSLFGVGNDARCQHVSETNILEPVVPPGEHLGELDSPTEEVNPE